MAITGEDIYIEVNNQSTKGDRKEYISRLSTEKRALYNKYLSKLRQQRYREEHKATANERSKEIMIKNRAENPDKYKQLNIEHNKVYRAKIKEEHNRILNKAEGINIVKEIIGDLINAIPNEVKKKRNREAVAKCRAKKNAK
jgi:hypothetical protein